MEIYKNAATGQEESLSDLTWLWALLFGFIYFLYRGVWRHILIQVVALSVIYSALGPPGTLLAIVMWLGYAVAARSVVRADLERRGFRLAPAHQAPAATRACPFCAEQVLTAAVKCKHCGSTLEPEAAPIRPPGRVGIGSSDPVPQKPPV